MTSKSSDQTARMRRLIGGFAGRTYGIVGNLMSWLILYSTLNRNGLGTSVHVEICNRKLIDKHLEIGNSGPCIAT